MICSVFNTLVVFAVETPNNGDLVFCPLQRQWVKKSEPKRVVAKAPLSDICGSKKTKAVFLLEMILAANVKVKAEHNVNIGELFVSFSAKGGKAFSELPSAPDSPKRPLTVVDKVQAGSISSRGDFLAITTQIFSLQQLSRPPTELAVSNFYSPQITDLQSAAYAINTRGPPVA